MNNRRRLLSLAAALGLSLVGHLLVWSSGGSLAQTLGLIERPVAQLILGLAGVALGTLLVALAVATTAFSGLGAIVLGILHLVLGVVALVPAADGGRIPPVVHVLQAAGGVSREASYGLGANLPTGIALATGAVFLASGIAASMRRRAARPAGLPATLLSLLVLPIAGLGIALIAVAGGHIHRLIVVILAGQVPVDMVVRLVIGAALLGLVAASTRFSSLGAGIAGGVLAGGALVGMLFAHEILFGLAGGAFGGPSLGGITAMLITGQFVLIGGLLIGGAVGSRVVRMNGGGTGARDSSGPQASPVV